MSNNPGSFRPRLGGSGGETTRQPSVASALSQAARLKRACPLRPVSGRLKEIDSSVEYVHVLRVFDVRTDDRRDQSMGTIRGPLSTLEAGCAYLVDEGIARTLRRLPRVVLELAAIGIQVTTLWVDLAAPVSLESFDDTRRHHRSSSG